MQCSWQFIFIKFYFVYYLSDAHFMYIDQWLYFNKCIISTYSLAYNYVHISVEIDSFQKSF
jgi:hypothetical protein